MRIGQPVVAVHQPGRLQPPGQRVHREHPETAGDDRVDVDLHGPADLGQRHRVGVGHPAAGVVQVGGGGVLQRRAVAEPAAGAQVGRDHPLQLLLLPVQRGAAGHRQLRVVQLRVQPQLPVQRVRATAGIRDEPPTSSTRSTRSTPRRAASARQAVVRSMVRRSSGAVISLQLGAGERHGRAGAVVGDQRRRSGRLSESWCLARSAASTRACAPGRVVQRVLGVAGCRRRTAGPGAARSARPSRRRRAGGRPRRPAPRSAGRPARSRWRRRCRRPGRRPAPSPRPRRRP